MSLPLQWLMFFLLCLVSFRVTIVLALPFYRLVIVSLCLVSFRGIIIMSLALYRVVFSHSVVLVFML